MNPTQGVSNFPWIIGQDDDASNATLGGRVIRMKAAATLLIYDAVYISGDLAVNKATNQKAKRIGIVVGGESFGKVGEIATDSASGGATAATVNQWVYVCILGITYVKVAAAIAVGLPLVLDSVTAGRVKAGALITGTGGVLTGVPGIGSLAVGGAPGLGSLAIGAGGTPVVSTAANGAIITGAPSIGTLVVTGAPDAGTLAVSAAGTAGDSNTAIIGMLVEASANANEYKRALIYLA